VAQFVDLLCVYVRECVYLASGCQTVIIGQSAAQIWRHIDFSPRRPLSQKSISGFRFSNITRLRRWKSICIPNID